MVAAASAGYLAMKQTYKIFFYPEVFLQARHVALNVTALAAAFS